MLLGTICYGIYCMYLCMVHMCIITTVKQVTKRLVWLGFFFIIDVITFDMFRSFKRFSICSQTTYGISITYVDKKFPKNAPFFSNTAPHSNKTFRINWSDEEINPQYVKKVVLLAGKREDGSYLAGNKKVFKGKLTRKKSAICHTKCLS